MRDVEPGPLSLRTAVDGHAAATPDRPALITVSSVDDLSRNVTVSYSQLRSSARRLAGRLMSRLRPGDRVVLPTNVSDAFVVALLACQYAGAVAVPTPVPTRYPHHRRRLSGIVEASGAAVLCHSPEDGAALAAWRGDGDHRIDMVEAEVLRDPAPDDEGCADEDGDSSTALIQYTSGSTSAPKGVVLTHANLYANFSSFRSTLGFDSDTKFGGWIPQYHDMGLLAQVTPALFLGSTCHLMTPNQFLRRPSFWLRMIEIYGVNHSCAPNFAFDLCLQRVAAADRARLDLSCLRHLINGSEPIRAETVLAFQEAFAASGLPRGAVRPCYGLAESTVFVSGSRPRDLVVLQADRDALRAHRYAEAREGAGAPLVGCGTADGYDLRIVEPRTAAELGDGHVGEIWLRGDSVSPGYWNDPAATEATFRGRIGGEGPYLRTGDLGFTLRGELHVTGRMKEMIVVHGANIYPQDVEHELRLRFPELRGRLGVAFGWTSGDGVETLGICHEIGGAHDDASLAGLCDSIRIWLGREWGVAVSSVSLLQAGDVARTTSGKIQRIGVADQLISGSLRPRHQWRSEDFAATASASADAASRSPRSLARAS